MSPLNNDFLPGISMADAAILTENWQSKHDIKAFLFRKADLLGVLNNSGLQGLRFYMGIEQGSLPTMLVVGVDTNFEDIINVAENSDVYNFALPCPAICDNSNSPLMHESANPLKRKLKRLSELKNKDQTIDFPENLTEVTFKEAFDWTDNWQKTHDFKAIYFDASKLMQTLNNSSATMLRVYMGLDSNDKVSFIFIGVDEEGNDEKNPSSLHTNDTLPCDTNNTMFCDTSSKLYH